MVKSICILACSLAIGQAGDRGDWQLTPQLARGLELIYSGTYHEESLAANVHYQKSYRLDTTLFVLDAAKQQWDVAIMTALAELDPRQANQTTPPAGPMSVRLELAKIDQQGRLYT